ncbi:MAG: DNA-processing protein DprA [Desulfosarcinaceae bacterium]|nr:DNA-processing protein DprA [Desulfosarcinaceae bacterium]
MENTLPWLTLKGVPGVGNLLFKRLLDRFGSPQAALAASQAELTSVAGISARIATAIRRQQTPDEARRELDLADHHGFKILTQTDPAFPKLLRQLPDPPPLLYVNGHLHPDALHIAMVGSRSATRYGLEMAHAIAKALAEKGVGVVSGMARGIDGSAHEGALAAGGYTTAVLGSGLLQVYPREHRKLYERIATTGAVISELPLNARPEGRHFPARNRIISGMAVGVIVVEAALKSGSLITARLAAEQNREVFAVPGSIRSRQSQGTHALIKQGASLVESAADVLDTFFPAAAAERNLTPAREIGAASANPPTDLTSAEADLLSKLEPYPQHIDTLAALVSMPPGEIAATLLQLELKGLARQLPGNLFEKAV